VVERLLRRTTVDTLVVRDLANVAPTGAGGIVACLDGSARSYGALAQALDLSRAYGKHVQIVAARDPGRPEDALLDRHLEVALAVAARRGAGSVDGTVIDGYAPVALNEYVARSKPWLVAVGRDGIDAVGDGEIGSTAERLVRESTHNVLVAARQLNPVEEGA